MILNLIAIGAILGVTWVWARAGVFAALLHLLCTIVAGAVAFALWEPIAYAILGAAPTSGFFSFIESVAWAAALIAPFAITLIVLRALVDVIVPGNLRNGGAFSMAGGGALGLISGYLSVGIIVIGLGFLRLDGVLGFRNVDFDAGGSVTRSGNLWVRADSASAAFFRYLSNGTLRTATPLDRYYPDLETTGYAMQLSFEDGKSRNAIRPADFDVTGGFRVGAEDLAMNDLVAYDDGNGVQQVLGLDGERPARGRLFGYTVAFESGARESFGQVVLTGGQVRLVAHNARTGDRVTVHPHGVVSQADPTNAEGLGRWRFTTPGDPVSSVGGAANANMTFEFAVPAGFAPESLYVKNVRADVAGVELTEFGSASALVDAINAGRLGGGAARVKDIDTGNATTLQAPVTNNRTGLPDSVSVNENIGFTFRTSDRGGLDIDGSNRVLRGSNKFFREQVDSRNQITKELRVDKFFVPADKSMVKVDVSADQPGSLLGGAVRAATGVLPPQLIDVNGTPYEAVGYIYQDKDLIEVRIDQSNTIRSLSQLRDQYNVALSQVRDDQRLTLLFMPTKGVEIKHFALGSKVILDFEPPITTN